MLHTTRLSRQAFGCHSRRFLTKLATSPHNPTYAPEALLSSKINEGPQDATRLPIKRRQQLDEQIISYVKSTKPPKSILEQRRDIITRLQKAVSVRYGPRFSVQPFGSTVYGADSARSDMDLVLLDYTHHLGFHPTQKYDKAPEAYRLSGLARTLRSLSFKDIRTIPATVNLVTGVDVKTGIHIDLNVNDRLGLINTHMIKRYSELSPLLVPLLYFIKVWAKSHKLNSPGLGGKNRSLSSYCYALMTIGYLQHIRVLPNLQWASDTLPIDDRKGFWIKDKRDTKRTFCDVRFWQNGPPEWSAKTSDLTISEALLGWFRYWGSEHRYETTKLTIRLGGVVPRQVNFIPPNSVSSGNLSDSKPPSDVLWPYSLDEAGVRESLSAPDPDKWAHNLLIVDDPFIRDKNVGGNMNNTVVQRLISKCRDAVEIIEESGSLEDTMSPGDYLDSFVTGAGISGDA